MNTRRFVILRILNICLLISVLPAAFSSSLATEGAEWGTPVNGLQMSLSAIGSLKGKDQEFQAAFWNVGDRDITLNLGTVLANGKVQLPDYIQLNLTDADGKTALCKFADKKYGFAAGRVDDYLIPLRAGSTYTLRFKIEQFWCREGKTSDAKSGPARNQVNAQFEGVGPKFVNLDMDGIKLMNFWTGKVQSNTLLMDK